MNRTQQTLAGLLALQVVLILFIRSPFTSASTTGGTPEALLPELDAITPARIELLGADDAKVHLRKADGGWQVEEAGGYPADGKKVDELLNDLKQIRVRRPVVSSSRYHKAFKVADDDFEGRVRIYDDASSDRPKVDLILGDSPNYRITNARVAGQDPVYEVRNLAPYDVRAAATAWADKELVEVPADQVSEIEVHNASGTFALTKGAEGWKFTAPAALADKAVNAEKVLELVRAAATLRVDEPVGPTDEAAQGLAAPAATVTLRWGPAGADTAAADESPALDELTVRVGSKVPDKDTQRYVTRSGFGFTATVWDSSVSKLVDQKPQDLTAAAS